VAAAAWPGGQQRGAFRASPRAHGVAVGTDVTVAVIMQAVNNALNGCGGG